MVDLANRYIIYVSVPEVGSNRKFSIITEVYWSKLYVTKFVSDLRESVVFFRDSYSNHQ